uniref:hypothetical protein n=1 Tax=Aquimarina pacifica TaxID=1296415 RepID=UPI000555B3CD
MYYTISRSHNLKEIGYYPQTSIAKGYNPVLYDGHRNVKVNEFPDFIPNYELDLHSKAKPTSFIHHSVANFGWVINGRLKDIMESYNLLDHHFYKMKLHHNGITLNYFWFHYIVRDFWKYLDKEKSYG